MKIDLTLKNLEPSTSTDVPDWLKDEIGQADYIPLEALNTPAKTDDQPVEKREETTQDTENEDSTVKVF